MNEHQQESQVESAVEASATTRQDRLRAQLAKGRAKAAANRAAGIQVERKTPPGSRILLKAIKENCIECQGGDADPGLMWRIGNCEVSGCKLRPYRPYQKF